jgi:hypothetical protein
MLRPYKHNRNFQSPIFLNEERLLENLAEEFPLANELRPKRAANRLAPMSQGFQ